MAIKVTAEGYVQFFLGYLAERGQRLEVRDHHLWHERGQGREAVRLNKKSLERMLRTWMLESKITQTQSNVSNMIKVIAVKLSPYQF